MKGHLSPYYSLFKEAVNHRVDVNLLWTLHSPHFTHRGIVIFYMSYRLGLIPLKYQLVSATVGVSPTQLCWKEEAPSSWTATTLFSVSLLCRGVGDHNSPAPLSAQTTAMSRLGRFSSFVFRFVWKSHIPLNEWVSGCQRTKHKTVTMIMFFLFF